MKIGVFGGSFNPIHVGHVELGRWLVAHGSVEQLWYMVSPQNPLKADRQLMPEALRLELVRLALEGDNDLVASDFEFALPRPSYTVNTLAALREAYPQHEFVLVVGEDNMACFDRWYRTDEILRHHCILVYHRPGYATHTLPDGCEWVETPLFDISSTAVREAMQQDNYNGEGLPPAVWNRLSEERNRK